MKNLDFPAKAEQLLAKRIEENNFRSLSVFDANNADFFQRLSRNRSRIAKIQISHHHAGSTGSRLISGNSAYYEKVERYLADFYDAEKALLSIADTMPIWRFFRQYHKGAILFCMMNYRTLRFAMAYD